MECLLGEFVGVWALLIRIPGFHVAFQVLAGCFFSGLLVLVHHSLFLYARLV